MRHLFLTILSAALAFPAFATGDNIAPNAKVEVSSEIEGYEGNKTIDGKGRLFDQGEWRSKGSVNFYGQIDYPWIKLDWEREESINEVLLYDRPSPDSHVA